MTHFQIKGMRRRALLLVKRRKSGGAMKIVPCLQRGNNNRLTRTLLYNLRKRGEPYREKGFSRRRKGIVGKLGEEECCRLSIADQTWGPSIRADRSGGSMKGEGLGRNFAPGRGGVCWRKKRDEGKQQKKGNKRKNRALKHPQEANGCYVPYGSAGKQKR